MQKQRAADGTAVVVSDGRQVHLTPENEPAESPTTAVFIPKARGGLTVFLLREGGGACGLQIEAIFAFKVKYAYMRI